MPPTSEELKADTTSTSSSTSNKPQQTTSSSLTPRIDKLANGKERDQRHGPMKEREIVEFEHNHSFMHVIGALFNKFPDKDFPDVHSCTVTDLQWDPETKILKQTRLFELVNPAPYLLRVLFKSPYWRFEEISIVDFSNFTLELKTVNLDFLSIADTFEASFYRIHPEDSEKTFFKQVAGLALNPYACLGMNARIENHALAKVQKSAALAIKLFEKKLDALKETPPIPGFDMSQIEFSVAEYKEATEAHLP